MKTGLFARAAACVLVAGALSVATAGTSLAGTAQLNITYSCNFSIIGAQDMPTTVSSSDLPDSATAGVPTAPSNTTVKSTVSEDATTTLFWLGAKSVDGTMTSQVPVTNEGATQTLTSVSTIPNTPVPTSGTFDVTATGTFPAMTLVNAGTATITLGSAELKLTPRQANGDPTWLGTITVPCTVKAGQNTQFYSFPVA
ncbi:hypothetical protein C8D88_12435 [Lentzea atacamensis]|uniref:DUF6801 domain-containing protein n=1 Tax=Lentzea atacamensis TaxID=531938 RepID=A0A316HG10_9PSEU|nr:DUF6801 domain-containing protein [Lentzea atacamensis]PWK79508.1 hypothetical protein C8D88_12435 [Lentzea atacamensis]RAS69768.1 hypothetical protein C8D87_10168 [Lentzea atacamensis]